MSPETRPPTASVYWLLRRADQWAVAVLVGTGLLAVASWWVSQGGLRGRAIEFDGAPPQSIPYVVDVNSATWPELAQLPGIGETLARRIVDSREQDGPFSDPKDLRRVRGIGPKTLQRLRPYLQPMPDRETVVGR
jgi:competence protein ComEA